MNRKFTRLGTAAPVLASLFLLITTQISNAQSTPSAATAPTVAEKQRPEDAVDSSAPPPFTAPTWPGGSQANTSAKRAAEAAKQAPTDPLLIARTAAVKKRASEFFALILKAEYEKAWEFHSTASKRLVSKEVFAAESQAKSIRSAEIDSVQCRPELCAVTLTLNIATKVPRLPTAIVAPIAHEQDWVFQDENFWLIRRP